jgi:UDP-N-acetylglucosamine transferase subunit ALG13
MIFAAVGTEQYPFDRLVRAIDGIAANGEEEAFIQVGHATYVPRACEYAHMLPFNDLVAKIEAARVVVVHAGVGLTLLCANAGKVPILVPRLPQLGEHVDDHQLQLGERLEALGRVILARAGDDLPRLVREYADRCAALRFSLRGTCGLTGAIAEALGVSSIRPLPSGLRAASPGLAWAPGVARSHSLAGAPDSRPGE